MSFATVSPAAISSKPAGAYLKYIGEIAINYRVTEKILAEIERRLFNPDPVRFDIELVKASLSKLKALPPQTPSDEFLHIEFSLDQEFNLWRGLLEERDRHIETYHLRRFFDTANQEFDRAVFVALAYFYRSSPFFLAHLSKFDLVLTRLYSVGSQPNRQPRLSRDELTADIAAMFRAWDDFDAPTETERPGRSAHIAKLDEFILEAETLAEFEELVRSDIFERLRAYKRELGRECFEPEVAAVIIECNLVLGNVFNELLARANRNLGEKLNASFDFAGAFHDSSPETNRHFSDVLKELRSDRELAELRNADAGVQHIWELLHSVCGANPNNRSMSFEAPFVLPEKPAAGAAGERLRHLFATLEEPEPDVRMLRDYTQKSKSLWTIDLNDFIRSDEPELDRLCRDVLRVILLSDELCAHDLTLPKEIPQATLDELSGVFQKSLELGEILEVLLEKYHGHLQNRLLVVSNKFLETRLKLERTIVRFSNLQLGRTPSESSVESSAELVETPEPAFAESVPRRTNRWLIAATMIVALLCGGAYFAALQMEEFVPVSQETEEMPVETLPSSEHLFAAYRHKGTIFVITKDSWEGLPEDERRSAIEKFTEVPAAVKIENVIVTNSAGRPQGDASSGSVNLSPEL
jgi:hypothetical protein